MQIRTGKRCDTVCQKHAVDDSQNQPEDGQKGSHENPPAHQIN